MAIKALLNLASMMAMNGEHLDDYSMESVSRSDPNPVEHTKRSSDGRQVTYYVDEKGNIRRKKQKRS